MLVKGMAMTFWSEIFLAICLFVLVNRAKSGLKVPKIHKIPGLDAIDEAVGRATELGKPVHVTPGAGDLQNAQTYAGLSILGYVARSCAKYNTQMLVTARMTMVYPIAEAITRQSYLEEGKSDHYNSNNIRFMSEELWAWAGGVVGLILRERVAANVMVGAFWAESLFIAENASSIGAIQIAGTASTAQIPFFVAACDYTLIGEEIYAASAYLRPDALASGTLIVQDWAKMLGIAVIVVGALLSTAGNKFLLDVLNW